MKICACILTALLLVSGRLLPAAAVEADWASSVQQLYALAGTNHWAIYPDNPVLRLCAKGEWDAIALGSMTVLRVGDLFHLYYEAWGVRGNSGADYNSLPIGHATSRDGMHWTKDPANPVLPKGTGSDWDRDGTWDPFVLHEKGVFKMWYGGGMDNHCDWGYATSTNGVQFVKRGQISHLGNVEDDHAIHDPATGRYAKQSSAGMKVGLCSRRLGNGWYRQSFPRDGSGGHNCASNPRKENSLDTDATRGDSTRNTKTT